MRVLNRQFLPVSDEPLDCYNLFCPGQTRSGDEKKWRSGVFDSLTRSPALVVQSDWGSDLSHVSWFQTVGQH